MKFQGFIFVFLVLIAFACSKSEITPPPTGDDANLAGTSPIPFTGLTTIKSLEGIYELESGSEGLGTQFVCKVSKYKVSFFSNTSGVHILLKYGYKASDGSIQFSGFWRASESPNQGNIQFVVSAEDGAADILGGVTTNLKLQGMFSGNQFTLKFKRNFTAFATNNPFMIFAHHGIQTTVDPPYAENSINMILNAEDYGVTGLELDVRMTKDNVPILIHDATINTRLTMKGPLFGSWDLYDFALITQFVTLIDGQKVPSVEQALIAFVDETNLKYFWMDIKGNPDIFKYLEPIVRRAYARAAVKNRDVVIFAGLPSSDIIAELKKQPTYQSNNPAYSYSLPLPTLAEETMDKAIELGSQFFGPRYTLGLLLPDVQRGHSQNPPIKTISWTLNARGLITNYLQNGEFDGMITDYPTYVVYDFYTMF